MSKKKAAPLPEGMSEIEALASAYGADRESLAVMLLGMQAKLAEVRNLYIPQLRKLVGTAKASRLALHQAVDANRALFAQPRSRIFYDIRVGLKKGAGKVSFENAARVVKLIEKHLPDQAELLIATEKKPVKAALAQLAQADLKRIGCEISGTGDQVLVQPVNSQVEKLVEALMADEPEETEE